MLPTNGGQAAKIIMPNTGITIRGATNEQETQVQNPTVNNAREWLKANGHIDNVTEALKIDTLKNVLLQLSRRTDTSTEVRDGMRAVAYGMDNMAVGNTEKVVGETSLSFQLPGADKVHRLLRRDKGAVDNDDPVTLTDMTFLKKKTENDYQILKAKMAGKDVVVKLTFEEEFAIPRLKNESQIYVDYLKPLWGIHVPQFYGFYLYDPLDPNELSCACMILQYCGEPAVSDLLLLKDYRGTKTFRNDIMDIVFRLHSPEIALEHDTLNASHILDFEGKPFLIDFAGAEPHECMAWIEVDQLTREVLGAKEGEILQNIGSDSVECYELWMFLKSLHYWIPYEIRFYGYHIECHDVTSAASLYQKAVKMWPRFKSEQQMWDDSVTEWRRIHSNWKKYHPDAVVEPPLGIVDFQEYLKTDV